MIEDFCKWIIGGMGAGYVALGAYIVKQHIAERKLLREWLKSLQAHNSILGEDD